MVKKPTMTRSPLHTTSFSMLFVVGVTQLFYQKVLRHTVNERIETRDALPSTVHTRLVKGLACQRERDAISSGEMLNDLILNLGDPKTLIHSDISTSLSLKNRISYSSLRDSPKE